MIDYIYNYHKKNYDISINRDNFQRSIKDGYMISLYDLYKKNSSIEALNRRHYWIDNKEKFVIMSVKSIDEESCPVKFNISIIDLDGKVLLDTEFFDTTKDNLLIITENPSLKSWVEIWLELQHLIKCKTILAYNAGQIVKYINAFCENNGIPLVELFYECIMYNTMDILGIDTHVSLQELISDKNISHAKALDECYICLDLLKSDISKIYKRSV